MTAWQTLFERGADADVSRADIHAELDARRGE
ncbi:hypothetical protein HASA104033_00455 [Halobacterium salinarum]|uniref:Uncharacterized protein n=4 Tax=Halobacterium salinarum TaxID=2242 RepID=A0A510N884_HALSA|nr:hypothetical protein [Halobacterium salinarum]QCC45687.1 uncharacterized protein HBSAL_10220 [Halobacterium salinarum]CAP14495.1 uncharacterized protein OE_3859B1F [Halobacterium salinarum R1]DAC78946.1 TPA_inf: uncharacterized protein VNG_2041a [Halobacterium salinarum NRC-1]